MTYDLTILEQGCDCLGIHLDDVQKSQFIKFYEYLIEKNKVMNLTGITDFQEVLTKHFLDSLACTKALDMEKIHTAIDIGTGAGFPGIPLKIAFPDVEFVLLDSLNKRVNFLNNIIDKCRLEKITAVHARAEEAAKNKMYRGYFDLCVSRAVANLSSLSEYCLPYVKLNGRFISYKSGNIDIEIKEAENAVKILGGRNENIIKFTLPKSDIERSFVIIEKVKETPAKYPRKAGLPTKDPLK